jgi:hypothetical protein
VVLIGDSTTYSAGDLFAAGFVDNRIGPFVCVGEATGAGGANVWDYAGLKRALAGTEVALPALPEDIGLSFSFRRATRSGGAEGRPIEDVGIDAGQVYAMTRDDLLDGNVDLPHNGDGHPAHPPVESPEGDARSRERRAVGRDRRARPSRRVRRWPPGRLAARFLRCSSDRPVPAGAKWIELRGYAGSALRQRRRLKLSRSRSV